MLKTFIQEAVTTQMRQENNRAGNLALEAFYSAEEARILIVYVIRLFLGSDIDILPQIIKDAQDQARRMSHWRYMPTASRISKYKMAMVTLKYIRDKE